MAITKEQFIRWAKDHGWEQDVFGHFHKSVVAKEGGLRAYRFKVSNVSVRYEVQVLLPGGDYSGPKREWMRLRSGYFKDLSIGEDGRLQGLKF
jgi:hypothetical protein